MFRTEQPRYLGVDRSSAPAADDGGILSFFGQVSPRYQGVGTSPSGAQTIRTPIELQNPQIRPDSAASMIVKAQPVLVPVPANVSKYRATTSVTYAGNRTNPAPLSAILVGFDEPAEAMINPGQTAIQLTATWAALVPMPIDAAALRCLVTVEFS